MQPPRTHSGAVSLRPISAAAAARRRNSRKKNITLTISSPPGDLRVHIDMAAAVSRGTVANGGEQDRLITVRDIDPVREERLVPRYLSDDRFYERNPIPEVWVRVANCRELEWAR